MTDGKYKSIKRHPLVWAFLASLAVVLLYPFESLVVPELRLHVVDESGNPLPNMGVREIWQNYSIEGSSHEEDSRTNFAGYVYFSRRTVRVTLLKRILYPIFNSIGGVHSSWGPNAHIMALVPDASKQMGGVTWRSGEPLPEQIIVRPLRR